MREQTVTYWPIDEHGLIGNTRSAALVAPDASIVWMCLPRFDSPSLFAAILDDRPGERGGGRFSIEPVGPGSRSLLRTQYYWPDTNVLVTRFSSLGRVAEIIDFMPAAGGEDGSAAGLDLVRIVRVVAGTLSWRASCGARFDYARATHRLHVNTGAGGSGGAGGGGATFESGAASLALGSTVPLRRAGPRGAPAAEAAFTLEAGQGAVLTLRFRVDGRAAAPRPLAFDKAMRACEAEVAFWRRWAARCTYRGRWRERVLRSALALKLLTHGPTGAIVAAPTASLPERIGGTRNWDYRYAWLRDAAFTVYGFLRIGLTEEATRFMEWLEARMKEREGGGPLRPLYRVDGGTDLTEETLPHLEGYRGSGPVRIGNGASGQLQLDVTGAVMDAAYLHNKYAAPVSHDLWNHLRALVDWTGEHWRSPDEGIWEVRGGRRHFVYSKLMCWVAMDRGIRLAQKRSFPADTEGWRATRDAIYHEIWERGWSPRRGAFVQAYGSEDLDAANLVMPLVFFISPSDPRLKTTLEAVRKSPAEGGLSADLMVYRYDPSRAHDGAGRKGETEGGFNLCTLWLIEALTRAGRSDRACLEDARVLFDRILHCSGPHGLYSEQTALNGEATGNYPQAFTHLAFISAAYNLDRALGGGEGGTG